MFKNMTKLKEKSPLSTQRTQRNFKFFLRTFGARRLEIQDENITSVSPVFSTHSLRIKIAQRIQKQADAADQQHQNHDQLESRHAAQAKIDTGDDTEN